MKFAAVLLSLALLAGCHSVRSDLSAPCVWRELDADPVTVADAAVMLPIVVSDAPEDRWAARFLAVALEETCGRRPDVLVERKGQSARLDKGLFIGNVTPNRGWDCPLSRTNGEAFRVVARDGCVRFLGRADYAVFDWCERELNLRYYCSDGLCAERRETVVACPVDYSDLPVFDCRLAGSHNDPWVRLAKTGSVHRGGVNAHAPSRWHADATLKAKLPEIFETGDTPMLCYGNPKTLAYYCQRIDRQIAGLEDSGGIVDTRRKVVTVCPWDAPVACTCSDCRPLYEGRSASRIVWGRFLTGLADWLAEAHPDYMISFLPYLNTCDLPKGWISRETRRGSRGSRLGRRRAVRAPLPPGICEAEPCTMTGLAMLKNDSCRRKEERRLRDWRRATGRKVLNWNYGCWPREWTSAPYLFGRTIQRHCADISDAVGGVFVCGGSDDPRLTLSMYVWRRCLWNPAVDVEAVYDEFARRMFGEAAAPMRAFIALQESCWNRPWVDDACSAHNVFEISYPRADVVRMATLLRDAVRLAREAGDQRAERRILRYVTGFDVFLNESAAVSRRCGRKVIRLGVSAEMVDARSVKHPKPWAETTVTTAYEGDELVFRVVCAEPAAARMDFAHQAKDFVWGNDCVLFAFEDASGRPKCATVYSTGEVDGADLGGFSATVGHDGKSWTVVARLRTTTVQRRDGKVLGNICRWRVGDRRLPATDRVPGSRYEHSRLDTCFTQPNDDPAAFVAFQLQ